MNSPKTSWEEFKTRNKYETTLQIPREIIKLEETGEEFEAGSAIKFENNRLIIKKEEFPNLKTLYACGVELEGVDIDCHSLENLYLVSNQLIDINVDLIPNLVNLSLTDNKLQKLNVKHLTKLEDLRCNINNLTSLDVTNLELLEVLDASMNNLSEIKLGNNPNLWSFDLAENKGRVKIIDGNLPLIQEENRQATDEDSIWGDDDINEGGRTFAEFPYLPNLMMLSFRLTYLKGDNERVNLILSSPELLFLDINRSNIEEIIYNIKYPLKTSEEIKVCDNHDRNPDASTPWETLFNKLFLARKAKQKGYAPPPPKTDEEKENQNPPITNLDDLKTDYPDFYEANKDEEEITITWEGLTGTIIFDGFQKLKKINVGNNLLSYLVVRNCPELTTLRYAYNKMKHDAFIDNCPKLETIDKHGYDGSVEWDKGENKDGQEQFNEKLAQKKDAEDKEKQRNELYQVLLEMLEKVETYADKGDYKRAEQKLDEAKKLFLQSHYYLSKKEMDEIMKRISKLEARLQSSQVVIKPNVNYFPFYLIFVIAWLRLGFELFKKKKNNV